MRAGDGEWGTSEHTRIGMHPLLFVPWDAEKMENIVAFIDF